VVGCQGKYGVLVVAWWERLIAQTSLATPLGWWGWYSGRDQCQNSIRCKCNKGVIALAVIVGSGLGGGCGSFWPRVSEVLLDLGWGLSGALRRAAQCMEATVSLLLWGNV
jgi:hypothetical protein